MSGGGYLEKGLRANSIILRPRSLGDQVTVGGQSRLAQASAQAVILQGYRVLYRETHILLDELAEAVAEGTLKEYMESVATVLRQCSEWTMLFVERLPYTHGSLYYGWHPRSPGWAMVIPRCAY